MHAVQNEIRFVREAQFLVYERAAGSYWIAGAAEEPAAAEKGARWLVKEPAQSRKKSLLWS
jgi:hypothetical protein